MTFSTRLLQRMTACIAILAVLLLFVAPIVSKNLAERHHNSAMMHNMTAMSASMSMMHHHSDSAMADHNIMPDEGLACGYCDLLVHVPLLLWVFIPFIWLILVISRAPPVPVIKPLLQRRETRIHRPRAPPHSALLSG
ncbi:DUF2946 domain-containing protein [Pantoea sp. LMR881]|uniref:DUF2946 domain-containing protein n=1 Tax=Pantoea sp. LMR881 TaxID=3014336 RepID=UPI0022AE6766|nr:DUF2946 domain-containing protein [Pantoea sp. LMR881]MCZ4057846.1 DUF2946 domain-containing protein [Pantoea sp. LMR881]